MRNDCGGWLSGESTITLGWAFPGVDKESAQRKMVGVVWYWKRFFLRERERNFCRLWAIFRTKGGIDTMNGTGLEIKLVNRRLARYMP